MPKMARNRSALHDVLAQGASNRDITVFEIQQFYSRKCIWKYCLWNGGHFVWASIC